MFCSASILNDFRQIQCLPIKYSDSQKRTSLPSFGQRKGFTHMFMFHISSTKGMILACCLIFHTFLRWVLEWWRESISRECRVSDARWEAGKTWETRPKHMKPTHKKVSPTIQHLRQLQPVILHFVSLHYCQIWTFVAICRDPEKLMVKREQKQMWGH